MTISWSAVASREPVQRDFPTFQVKDYVFPKVTDSSLCVTMNCKAKKFSGETHCFDCLRKVGRECDNFDTCGGYHPSADIEGKITSTLCGKCYKDIKSKCTNFETCGGRSKFDKESKSYFELCGKCYKDLLTRCVNFETCGGRTRYNYYDNKRFDLCGPCYKSTK